MSAPTQDPGSSGTTNEAPAAQEGQGSNPPADTRDLEQRLQKSEKALASATKQLAAFQKAIDDKAAAELSDLERQQAENQDLKSKLESANTRFTETSKRNALKLALKDAKAKNLDAAMKLADISALDVDDDGNVTGADELVKTMAKEMDFLFGSDAPPVNNGGGNPGGGPPRVEAKDYKNLKGAAWSEFQRKVQSGEIQL